MSEADQEAYLLQLYNRLHSDLQGALEPSATPTPTPSTETTTTSSATESPSTTPASSSDSKPLDSSLHNTSTQAPRLPKAPTGMRLKEHLLSELYILNQIRIKKQLWEMFDELASDESKRRDLQMIRDAKALVGALQDPEQRKIAYNEERLALINHHVVVVVTHPHLFRLVREGKAYHPQGFALSVRKSSIPHPEAGMGYYQLN